MIRKLNKRDEEIIDLTISMILEVADINLRKCDKYYEEELDKGEQYITNPLEVYSTMVKGCISNNRKNDEYLSRYVGLGLTISEIKRKLGKNEHFNYNEKTGVLERLTGKATTSMSTDEIIKLMRGD